MRPADIKTARAIVQKPFKEETKTGVKAEVKEEVQEEKPKHSRRRRSNRKQTSSSTTASDSGLATSPHSSPSDSRLESPEYEVKYPDQPDLWVKDGLFSLCNQICGCMNFHFGFYKLFC